MQLNERMFYIIFLFSFLLFSDRFITVGLSCNFELCLEIDESCRQAFPGISPLVPCFDSLFAWCEDVDHETEIECILFFASFHSLAAFLSAAFELLEFQNITANV